jgi:hypothetical protein
MADLVEDIAEWIEDHHDDMIGASYTYLMLPMTPHA